MQFQHLRSARVRRLALVLALLTFTLVVGISLLSAKPVAAAAGGLASSAWKLRRADFVGGVVACEDVL
jgi:hypothetical protein